MYVFLLIGIANTVPKVLVAVMAENLGAAAAKLGGRLHDVGTSDDPRYAGIYPPEARCGTFHAGKPTAEVIADAMERSIPAATLTPEEWRQFSHGLVGTFTALYLGQTFSV